MTKPLPEHTRALGRLVNRPGGITVTEAVAAAEQNLEGLRDRGLSSIAETISSLHALAGEMRPGPDSRQAADLYRMSNSLIGIAGVFGKSGLGEVALSLCTLIERLLLARQWDRSAIQLHVDSLRVLTQDGVTPVQIATIGAALRQVVDRLQPAEPHGRLN